MKHPSAQLAKTAALSWVGGLLMTSSALSEVTLSSDFTNTANQRTPIYNFWSVRNEIPDYPAIGSQKPPQANSMNCVRILGGWSDSSGNMRTSEDVCYWDGTQYAYRWGKLTDRIDAILAEGKQIHQLVLDNVPWDFQRGFSFGSGPGDDYPASSQVATYGNSLPPSDPVAWSDFIKAAMNKLIQTYGLAQVEQWRFRIGTESDYFPHHWAGTKTQFFNHYKNTAEAVLSVLPNARLSAHFLGAGGNGRYGAEFVRWCAANNVRYDFIGVSIYPFYNNSNQVDLDRVYNNDFKPFVNQPEWNPNARMEIPEYSLFTEKDDDGFNMGVGTSHNPAFVTMLAKMAYANSITQIQTWGDKTKDPVFVAIGTMLGLDRFAGQKTGNPASANNKIDGIFAADVTRTAIDAMIYNYNSNPTYIADETVNLSFTIPLPPGTPYEYRIATYDRDTNPQQLFQKKYVNATKRVSEGGWIVDRVTPTSPNLTDINGTLDQIIVEPGKSIWNSEKGDYSNFEDLQWSGWTTLATATGTGAGNSNLNLTVPLSSFSFQKIEFRKLELSPPWKRTDIGSPAATGKASNSTGVFELSGSGNDIWNTGDNFHYVYQPASGNCEILARVLSLENTHVWAKAGVMIRETLDSNSKNAVVLVTPANGVTFQQRVATGGTSSSTRVAGLTAPYWVKLKRIGDTFTGSRSVDASNWTALGTTTIPMASNVYFGLAVCSHDDGVLTTATIDNVGLSIPVAHAGSPQTVIDFDANGSEPVTLDGTESLSGIGNITSYSWSQGGTQIATGPSPEVILVVGVHPITLTVTNDSGATDSATVSIMVSPFAKPSDLTIPSDLKDASPISNNSVGSTATDPSYYAGQFNNVSRSPVFVFQLPALGPVAQPFTSASVSLNLHEISTSPAPVGNVDLYGLGIRGTPTVLASDYWADTDLVDTTDATFLQDNILTPSSTLGTTTSVDIADYLNAQYASGAGAGQFVFLRLSTDADLSNSQRYFITSADGAANIPDETIWPRINGTVVIPYPDTDLDGMPDQWEMQTLKTLDKIASGDEDGDGTSNLAEYIAGTHPKNSSSRFSLSDIFESSPGSRQFTLRWPSVMGRSYKILRSSQLEATDWPAISVALEGTAGELSFTDTPLPTDGKNFYKIKVYLP